MRTNVVIDDDLMQAALRASALKTRREVVELGLRTLLRLNRQRDSHRLRGRVHWQGDHNAMRRERP